MNDLTYKFFNQNLRLNHRLRYKIVTESIILSIHFIV